MGKTFALTVALVHATEDRILYDKSFTTAAKYMGLEQYDRTANGSRRVKEESETYIYMRTTAIIIAVSLVLMLVGYMSWCQVKKYKDKKKREEEEKKRAQYKDPEALYHKQNMMSTPGTMATPMTNTPCGR